VTRFGVDKTVTNAVLGRLAAGSLPPGEFTATIDWGDGSPAEAAPVAGRDYVTSQRQGRSLITVSGSHTYAADGVYHGKVSYTRQGVTTEVPFVATGVPACTTMLTGARSGPLTVSSGVACLDGATISGPVSVTGGAGIYLTGSTVSGPVSASGAGNVLLCGTTVSGPVSVTGKTRVWIGNAAGDCAPSTVSGPVSLRNNTGSTVVSGNRINGPLSCSGNTPAPTNAGRPNSVSGPKSGQCAGL
jgi:hexosaminidase